MSPSSRGPRLSLLSVSLLLLAFLFSSSVVGAVEPWSRAVLGLLVLLAFLTMLASGRLLAPDAGGRRGPSNPEKFLLGLLLLGLLQLLPLPPDLHRTLSPEAARLFDRGLPPGDEGRWRTLSVAPHATEGALLHLAALGMAFSLLARGLRGRAEARRALAGFVAAGALAAVLGIADQALGGDLLGWYPREARFPDRLAGVLVNPNHFAGMMALVVLAGLGLLLGLAAPTSPDEGPPPGLRALLGRGLEAGADRGPAVALLLALLACTAALLLTASRLGSFSLVAGLGLLALLLSRSRRPGRALAGLGAAVAFLLGVNALVALDPVLERWTLFFGGGESAEGRIRAWSAVASMGERFLVPGSGLGTFPLLFPAYQPPDLRGTWDAAHNDFLQAFAEGGLAGTLLWLGFFASWAARVGRAALRGHPRTRPLAAGCLAAVGALLVHATGDFNFQVPGNALLTAVIMGVGWSVACVDGGPTAPGVELQVPAG